MNWYTRVKLSSITFTQPLNEAISQYSNLMQQMQAFDLAVIPDSYDVVQYDTGQWAIIRKDAQGVHQSQIVRDEPSKEEVLKRAIPRIGLIESMKKNHNLKKGGR